MINFWRCYFKFSLGKITFRYDIYDGEEFPKVLYKNVLLSITKVPHKSVLLSIIICRYLSLTYHTQKYFIKAFHYLAKSWLCVI